MTAILPLDEQYTPVRDERYDRRYDDRFDHNSYDNHYDPRYENQQLRSAAHREESEHRYDAGIDQVRYWVGAALTAAIAAMAGLVGFTVLNGVFHLGLDAVNPTVYGLSAAGIAIGAATLYYGMLHVAPRPAVYYSWLAIVTTLLAAVIPFATPAAQNAQIALAGLNIAVGLIVAGLVPIAAVQAKR